MARGGRNSPDAVKRAQQRQQILELRALGLTLEQIGDKVGLAKSNVKAHLDKALDALAEDQAKTTARLRALAYSRLERLLAKAMLLGASGNLKAMHQAQRLITAQARLLGFDAPQKHALTDPTGEVERAGLPPGIWALPVAPDTSLEAWQQAAAKVVEAQQQRLADAASGDS